MKLHIFIHEIHEDPGYIIEWVKSKNYRVQTTQFYLNKVFPSHSDYDMLIIMGGSMGANDEELYPWLKEEKNFIFEAIQKEKKVLGICLGCQLIASVLGSSVYKNEYTEIGFFEVYKSNTHPIFEKVPNKFVAFHWHNDTFEIPKGAIHLASSKACTNQSFIFEKHVLGLQFHCEITSFLLELYLNQFIEETGEKAKYIQSKQTMLELSSQIPHCNNILHTVLSNFTNL